MNFYKHHLGDYEGATAHLTWDEDQAYTRLLRVYYRLERAIPTDTGEACRLARAKTSSQRKAVEDVLREFFELRDDGWHNKRADEEIAQFREDQRDSAARKDNEKERQRRHRDRRHELFVELRKHGEVPPWDTTTNDLEALLSRVRNAPVTRTATATHEPLTNNHKPLISGDSREAINRTALLLKGHGRKTD